MMNEAVVAMATVVNTTETGAEREDDKPPQYLHLFQLDSNWHTLNTFILTFQVLYILTQTY